MNHLGTVLSFHWQKTLCGLAKNDRARTIFVRLREFSGKYAFRPDRPLEFLIGARDPNFWAIGPIFFWLASYTSQLLGGIIFGALRGQTANN